MKYKLTGRQAWAICFAMRYLIRSEEARLADPALRAFTPGITRNIEEYKAILEVLQEKP